jgi:hypothetical protein
MKNLLWLDDLRNPFLNEEDKVPNDIHEWNINWVLNYKQFVKWIQMYGLPDAISFDHDLAEEHYTPEYFWNNYEESKNFQDWKSKSYKFKTGEGCAEWLAKYCSDYKFYLPEIFIHSANPIGADKIKKVIDIFKTDQAKKLSRIF